MIVHVCVYTMPSCICVSKRNAHIAHTMTFYTSRSKKFDKVTSSSIELLTSDGSVAVKGTFDVMLNLCNITYVTTTAEYDKLLIHVHNGYMTTRTIHQVSV